MKDKITIKIRDRERERERELWKIIQICLSFILSQLKHKGKIITHKITFLFFFSNSIYSKVDKKSLDQKNKQKRNNILGKKIAK